MGQHGQGMAAFPFTVNVSGAGSSSLAFQDGVKPKQAKRPIAEMWLPIWSRQISLGELKVVLAEGRATVGRRMASYGVDFARALSELGVDRGLSGFARTAFLMRNGQSFLAIPLGVFEANRRENVDLLREIDPWLDSFRRACRTKDQGAKADPPPRFPSALRRIDAAIFDFCKYGGANLLADVLAALGAAERELAVGDTPPDKRRVRRPLAGLSVELVTACNDATSEFRLALSLAFLCGEPTKTGPIRRYLEPVALEKRRWTWAERGGHVVWLGPNLARNLGAVLARRLMDAESAGEDPLPLDSLFPAPLADVQKFLAGATDDERLADLLWGLMLIDPNQAKRSKSPRGDASVLPSAYALLKLTLLPGRLEWTEHAGEMVLRLKRTGADEEPTGIVVKPEPAIMAKLRAGDVQATCEIAARRLRASGLTPLASYRRDGSLRSTDWSAGGVSPDRLLAALLFPIQNRAVNYLAELVLRRPAVESMA
jgi:CRISPR-associated protein Csx17